MRAWENQANCRGLDPEIFFPSKYDFKSVKEAKKICASCLVKTQCADYATDNDLDDGIWGGMTKAERIIYNAILPTMSVSSDHAYHTQPIEPSQKVLPALSNLSLGRTKYQLPPLISKPALETSVPA